MFGWLSCVSRFSPQQVQILGSDIAAAQFMVKRGAAAKFVGRDSWFSCDKDGNTTLPNHYIQGFYLEALYVRKMHMTRMAFDNMSEFSSNVDEVNGDISDWESIATWFLVGLLCLVCCNCMMYVM